MNRDTFREKLVQRLEVLSDDKTFEACACDLLRAEWPNLVPAPGGSDAALTEFFPYTVSVEYLSQPQATM